MTEYEKMLTPVVMFDPEPFDDLTQADNEELKLCFSRYNGNVRKVTAYGEQAFLYYLEYQHEEEILHGNTD